jgi:hypothetical protein
MKSLDCLYASHKLSSDNPLCEGCSILSQSKPCHSVQDYDHIKSGEVLFLSDSFRYRFGKVHIFSDNELNLIKEVFPYPFISSTSVKCPSVKEADMSPDNMKICRQHLNATIEKVKPSLVFPCGNLAMKMLIKKSGITDKRGKSFEYETESGHSCTVVPIFHPYSVIKEPRHKFLFETDIKNAYEKYVLGKKSQGDFAYEVLMSVSEVEMLEFRLRDSNDTIAVDIETTGLNFLTDSIQTIAISSVQGNWVIPLDHKDSPFIKGTSAYPHVWKALRKILENPDNKKVFHNAKFDLKFLINHGIYAINVWDTKIMHHLIDENVPKSLMDLVKVYFPTELENL